MNESYSPWKEKRGRKTGLLLKPGPRPWTLPWTWTLDPGPGPWTHTLKNLGLEKHGKQLDMEK